CWSPRTTSTSSPAGCSIRPATTPAAIVELVRLVREQGWRPQLVVGLPVGFVGSRESKEALRRLMQVPRITNRGTRGGSPWAASAVNALMIAAIDQVYRQNQSLPQQA
ncbi:precorrin-8X methylmutase, partial [Ralstonia pseudosolanacearum]|uniref:precorrin-8X methylmutase n=1 Tax=Ralstonia pseudosolanacearum TaxID=1310165 RepID=UPI003D17D59D